LGKQTIITEIIEWVILMITKEPPEITIIIEIKEEEIMGKMN
jgi:hypothetical protein